MKGDPGERKKFTQTPKKGMLSGELDTAGSAWDWGGIDSGDIRDIICLVTERGGAIRFGYSRDGKAGSIGVYYGEQRDTIYCRPGSDYQDNVRPIVAFFSEKPHSAGRSPE